jgi:hypothetical protein
MHAMISHPSYIPEQTLRDMLPTLWGAMSNMTVDQLEKQANKTAPVSGKKKDDVIEKVHASTRCASFASLSCGWITALDRTPSAHCAPPSSFARSCLRSTPLQSTLANHIFFHRPPHSHYSPHSRRATHTRTLTHTHTHKHTHTHCHTHTHTRARARTLAHTTNRLCSLSCIAATTPSPRSLRRVG